VRGVGWVLRWAAALAVLSASATILVAFGYELAAERTLAQAAAAGIREAALPRATGRSVERAVRRQLASFLDLDRMTKITLERNGWVVRGAIQRQAGDLVSLTLSAPGDAALPRWLHVLTLHQRAATTLRIDERIGQSR